MSSLLLLAAIITVAYYISFCVKYFLLEQFGKRTMGVIIQKEQEQPIYQSGDVLWPIIQALVGRHELGYRFDDTEGRRYFARCRVNDNLHFYTKLDDPVEVLYLASMPGLNTLSSLLSVRFRELITVAGLFLGLAVISIGW